MPGVISTNPKAQFLTTLGVPMVGGTLTTYIAGTTTLVTTWQDQALLTANTNPIVLDARGECVLWLDSAIQYKFVLKNALGITQWTQDNISGAVTVFTGIFAKITDLAAYVQLIDLAASTGSALVGTIALGTGAILRAVEAKLRDIVARSDYNTDGNFNTAKAGKPNIDALANFDAPVTPKSEFSQLPLAGALSPVIGQNRARVLYQTETSVQVFTPAQLVMGGFRFAGSYKKGRAPLVSSGVNGSVIVGYPTALGAESSVLNDNWYGIFACSNAGSAAVTYKLMPFLRARSVAGSTVTLNFAGGGAGAFTPTFATYSFTTNNLAGVDCLVISEGGANRFSGRVTAITANTTTSVTLSSIGTVGAFDFLLPAPPGFTEYCYLGSFYADSAGNVLNIADSSTLVDSLGYSTADPNYSSSGSLANAQIRFGGYISPLAMGVKLRISENISTTSVGDFGLNISHDSSNHTIAQLYTNKEGAAGNYITTQIYQLNFSQTQSLWLTTIGGLAPSRGSCGLQVYGYLEP